MMGRLKSDQGQLFYELILATRFLKIIWCGGLMPHSIYPGCGASLHLTIRR